MISYLLISINILKPPKGVTELIGRIQKDSPGKNRRKWKSTYQILKFTTSN